MDLIDRKQAIKEIYRKVSEQESNAIQGEDLDVGVIVGLKMAVRIIKEQPSAEKTGKWEPTPKMGDAVRCSNCKKYWTWTFNTYEINYCPSCGARMVK